MKSFCETNPRASVAMWQRTWADQAKHAKATRYRRPSVNNIGESKRVCLLRSDSSADSQNAGSHAVCRRAYLTHPHPQRTVDLGMAVFAKIDTCQ